MRENFLSKTVLFWIFQVPGLVVLLYPRKKIDNLDPFKKLQALANLWNLSRLASKISNAKLKLCFRSALVFSTSFFQQKKTPLKWWQFLFWIGCFNYIGYHVWIKSQRALMETLKSCAKKARLRNLWLPGGDESLAFVIKVCKKIWF